MARVLLSDRASLGLGINSKYHKKEIRMGTIFQCVIFNLDMSGMDNDICDYRCLVVHRGLIAFPLSFVFMVISHITFFFYF